MKSVYNILYGSIGCLKSAHMIFDTKSFLIGKETAEQHIYNNVYIYIYILFQTDSFQILFYKGLASKSLTGAKESHHEGLSAEERETLQTKAAEDGPQPKVGFFGFHQNKMKRHGPP